MRIGVKPGQVGFSIEELVALWREAEEAGFESVWTYDQLVGPLCYEAVSLLAAMAVVTHRVRLGCLVLANGLRTVESLAAQLATIDALSHGRLEVGIGVGGTFARRTFEALGLPFPDKASRLAGCRHTIEQLRRLTGGGTLLGAKSVQAPLPLIVGGKATEIRALAREYHLAWNLSATSVAEFRALSAGQPDPQAQVFLTRTEEVSSIVAAYQQAGATRLVFVLVPPIVRGDLRRLARAAGL